MGQRTFGPPQDLIDILKLQSGARLFIETGTYLGNTAARMAEQFDAVWTVEVNAAYLERARAAHAAAHPNITWHAGDSAAWLAEIAPTLHAPTLVWLDAHRMTGSAGGPQDSPLLAEIEALRQAPRPPFILIDDVHIFEAGRPGWPSLRTVKARLNGTKGWQGYSFAVVDDVLVCTPKGVW